MGAVLNNIFQKVFTTESDSKNYKDKVEQIRCGK